MKILSNVIEMIGKIGTIVLKVTIPFIILLMILVLYVVSNVEVEENKITFKSSSIKKLVEIR